MATTIKFISSKRNEGTVNDYYNYTSTDQADTYTLVSSGRLVSVAFYDANANLITSNPPTLGTVAAGTIPGTNSAVVTANAGGVVTNGAMIVTHCGL